MPTTTRNVLWLKGDGNMGSRERKKKKEREMEGHITRPRTVHDNTWYCSKTCISRRAQPLPPQSLNLLQQHTQLKGGDDLVANCIKG